MTATASRADRAASEPATAPDPAAPIHGLTPQHIRDVLIEAGCRAEIAHAADGSEMVASALHGTGFTVRFVNAYEPNTRVASPSTDGFSDISFVYMPRIDGLPPGAAPPAWIDRAVADWNGTRRFAHLALISQDSSRFLALRWDLLVLGVTRDYLHASVRLWDQLMQEFFAFLRNRAGAAADGVPVQPSDTPLQQTPGTMRQAHSGAPDGRTD